MARQTGQNSPIIDSVQVPQLTDIATGNYQNVIQKTMDNYSQAMTALEGKAKVDQAANSALQQKNTQYAEQVAAVNRANSQQQGGNDWGSALAGIGKSLVSGLVANEQLQAQRDQQAFDNNVTTERLNLTKQEFQAKQDQEQQSAARDQLTSLVQSRLSEIEGEAYKTIQKGSYDQGIAYAEAQVGKIMSDPLFSTMSDANKFYVAGLGQSFITRIRKENLSQVRGEQDKIEDATINLAQTQWQYKSVELLKGIETGAGKYDVPTVEKGVKQLLQNAQDLVSGDTSLSTILTDKGKYIKFYSGVLGQINGALDKYYGQSGQWSQETEKYREAITQLSNLDKLRTVDPNYTEGLYQRDATLLLTSLGLSPDVSKIPTTQVNVARADRERQQDIEKTHNALTRSENLRAIQENNPNVAKAKDFLIAQSVFNTITNSNSSNLNTSISKLEYFIKEQPDVAESRGYTAQLNLLKKYREEQKSVTVLQGNAHKLEGEIAALNYKINPPDLREFIVQPGTPLGATQGVSESPKVVILKTPQTIPGANQEQLDSKMRELQSTYDQVTNIASYWADNGINIFNPKDNSYIKKMEVESQAARDLIKATPEYNQYQPSNQMSPTSDTTSIPKQAEAASPLLKALNWEVKRNGYTDLTVNYVQHNVPEFKTRESLIKPIQERIDELDSKYQSAVNNLTVGYNGGNTTNITDLKNTLVYNKAGMSDGQIKFMDGLMNEQSNKLDKLDKLLQTKSQWYRTKFGIINESSPPTNFSQGNGEPVRASQTPLPNQTQPLSPTMPLKGNLATSRYGFAPFKSGTVTFTSDFKGQTRSGSSSRPGHQGIDISSTDKRVATIQGGTVVVADMGKINPTGYGNTVVVKTGDGTYELYGHLDSINVKVGDKIDPATQIGIMGSSGDAQGAHLHFGVSTDLNTSRLTGTWLDPVQYLQKVSGKVTLPRGQGAPPTTQSNSVQSGNTGFYKISDRLTYMNGYVLDRVSGNIRKATQNEQANIHSYSPFSTVPRNSNNQPSNTNYYSQNGETVVEQWKIPTQAVQEKDYLFVHPTGRNAPNGNPILAVEGYRGNKKVFAVEGISGVTGISGDRDTPGAKGMLPDGSWSVARSPQASNVVGVGGLFLPLTYNGKTQRAAIGIHYDDNGVGTAGCLGIRTKADRDKVYNFIQSSSRQLNMYVNTKDVSRNIQRGSAIDTPNGNSNSSLVQSANSSRSSYPQKNNPNANYGYQYLKDNPRISDALAEAGDKAGVPAVWLADFIGSESGFSSRTSNTRTGATGVFQATPETLGWLGRSIMGRAMTKQEFINKGMEWQIRVALPAYLNIIGKEAGKRYNSFGDVYAAIWGGGKLLSRNPQDRMGVSDGDIKWEQLIDRSGRNVGRTYDPQASLPNITHEAPRDNCPICNQMQLNGNFTNHTIKGVDTSNYA